MSQIEVGRTVMELSGMLQLAVEEGKLNESDLAGLLSDSSQAPEIVKAASNGYLVVRITGSHCHTYGLGSGEYNQMAQCAAKDVLYVLGIGR